MSHNIVSRPQEIERRALVGFACALVVCQAFLATLAIGWSLPRVPADAAFAICHGTAGEPGAPEPAGDKPNILCGLCAHVIAGAALPAAVTTIGARQAAVVTVRHTLTPIRTAAVPVRAGAARAPPETI